MPRLRYGSPRVAVEIVAVSLVVGLVLGLLWPTLAPEVVGVVTAEGEVSISLAEAGGVFPRQATLAALAAGAGVVLSLYYMTRFRMRPVTSVLTLLSGGVAGTTLAVFVGRALGPGDPAMRAAQASAGDELVMPLTVDAYGLLAGWPLAATFIAFVVALVRDDRNPWGAAQSRQIGATAADVN